MLTQSLGTVDVKLEQALEELVEALVQVLVVQLVTKETKYY